MKGRNHRQNRHRRAEKGASRSGTAVHKGHHHPPVLCGMKTLPTTTEGLQGGRNMDAQTQIAAELYKTLNDAQKQEVLSMIDTLLSQQLNDQQSLDSHSSATEKQDSIA